MAHRFSATRVLHWPLSKTLCCMSKIHGSHPSCMPQLPYLGIYRKPVFLMLCLKVQGSFWNTAFSSVAQLCPTLCDPMDCSTLGFLVHHQLPELTQTHVHRVSDAIQPSHPLSSPSPPTLDLSQHRGLFKWASSSNQVAKVLGFQLQHQSFQWIFRADFL